MAKADPRIDALHQAIAKAGSQSALARLLGISQASVWGWLNRGTPLPAKHVLLVERELGVSRHRLRPDLYPREAAPPAPAAPAAPALAAPALADGPEQLEAVR